MSKDNFFIQQPGESSEAFQERIIAWKQETRGVDPTTLPEDERKQWLDDHRSGKSGKVSKTYENWLKERKRGNVEGSYDYDYPATSKPTVEKVQWLRGDNARVTWSDGSVSYHSAGEMEDIDY